MSKPRKQGMRQRFVPNNKADFMRKRLKWRRSEFTDRHEAACADRRERRELEELRELKERREGSTSDLDRYPDCDKVREARSALNRLRELGVEI